MLFSLLEIPLLEFLLQTIVVSLMSHPNPIDSFRPGNQRQHKVLRLALPSVLLVINHTSLNPK